MLYFCLALPLVFAAVLLARGLLFRPKGQTPASGAELSMDRAAACAHLQAMVRCPTVSAPAQRDEAAFENFRALLPVLYPRVFAACAVERVGASGLLLTWRGREPGAPAVFLAHYDVVPAAEAGWIHPPFSGDLEDGVLWGRGTLDMKNSLCGIFEAAEALLRDGFTPAHDICIALSGEEEVMGPSAAQMRDLFRTRPPAFVLDEGGDVMDGFFSGASATCAMVGVGEKGVGNFCFTARSAGGHAAIPPALSPLPRLCRAMERMRRPFPCRVTPALDKTIDTMGRFCNLPHRILFANRDILHPVLLLWLRRQSGLTGAMGRTTVALTQASGSAAGNVLPTEAVMFANLRLLWGDTSQSAKARLTRIIRDPQVELTLRPGTEPRPDSLLGEPFEKLSAAIRATWPEAVVTPYLMVACTDSRHWRDVCDHVYRFSAKAVTGEEKATVHGVNERIRVANVERAAVFYGRVMLEC